ncbi:efflux RND transporter periplasmic adaptor subunit [bacterium]|nr:efflux RND transporter periplasmic adaptor subunit [bacterium]
MKRKKKVTAIALVVLVSGLAIAVVASLNDRLPVALTAFAQMENPEEPHLHDDEVAATEEGHAAHTESSAEHVDDGEDAHAHEDEAEGHEDHDDEHEEDAHAHESETETPEGPDAHTGEQVVSFSPAQLERLGIRVDTATSGTLESYAQFPGEVRLNEDELIHVVPRLSGIVREVRATLGDQVKQGDIMAVLESRDLADLKAEYLAARERVALREATYAREKTLYEKQISPEQDYLEARQAVREAQIGMQAAEQKLHAVGFSENYLESLPSQPDATLTYYNLTAPDDGTVIEKHITRGEVLGETSAPFTIADLSTVWVDLEVYQKDIPRIREGQSVRINMEEGVEPGVGEISYIGPVVGEQTRTALARVVMPNPERRWRAGMFVNGRVAVGTDVAPIVVPKTALQTLEDQQVIFVRGEEGFEPQAVIVGRQDAQQVEIIEGLQRGQRYAATGAFTLKAELAKGSFDDGHNH